MAWRKFLIPVDLVLYTLFSQAQIADTQGLENNP